MEKKLGGGGFKIALEVSKKLGKFQGCVESFRVLEEKFGEFRGSSKSFGEAQEF